MEQWWNVIDKGSQSTKI